MERRVLLSAQLDAQIPASIAVNTGPQTLLAPSDNFTILNCNSTTVATSAAYRFVVNDASPGQLTRFSTSARTGSIDSAIALYDASGNRLLLQDVSSGNGNESVSVALQSGQTYTVEFFELTTSIFGNGSDNLDINPGAQTTADTLTFNPATGTGSLSTSSAPDAFNDSADVRYFPVNLFDAGQTATLTITPNGPDAAVAATLFARPSTGGAWNIVGTTTLAAGASSATLNVTPLPGLDITDATLQLAVAPLNFTAAAEPVTITASAPLLLPATIDPAQSHNGIGESLSAVGTLSGSLNGSFTTTAGMLASFRSPVDGLTTVTMTPTTAVAAELGVYGGNGSPLLAAVSSRTASTAVTTTFNATKGGVYFFDGAPNAGATNGSFTFTVSQTYSPTPISVTSTMGTQAALPLSLTGGALAFQLTPAAGTNYLALQLKPDQATFQVQLQIIGATSTARSFISTTPGAPVTVLIDQSSDPGPYDVIVSGAAGSGSTGTLKYVTLNVPTSISINQFPTKFLDLSTGGLTSGALPVTTGQPVGLQFFQLTTNAPLSLSTYAAVPSSDTTAVLLHYVQNGSTFQLAEAKTPNVFGTSSAQDVARAQALHAVVALPVNFSGAGTVTLNVSGPQAKGVGVGFVPNALPGQPAPPQGFQSTASISGATLASANQVDLYQVQLPNNLSATTSSLVFTPADVNGPLNATISILNSSNVTIATATNTPGQPLTVPVSGLTAGQTLRFLAQPTPGANVGSGVYGLSMTVNTTDPRPYLVTETNFFPFSSASSPKFPNITPTPITYSTSGKVSVTGNFTSTTPYNPNGTGSIQVYAISGFPPATAYQVTTTDIDPGANTNFALFYATSFNGNTPTAFSRVPSTAPSFDYFPSDRSQIDARVVVNNVDLDPTGYPGEIPPPYIVYVVVMNEQGTLGHYSVSVEPAPVTLTGPGTSSTNAQDLPFAPNAGSIQNASVLDSVNGNTYAIRTPADMSGGTATLNIRTLDASTGQVMHVVLADSIHIINTFNGTITSGQVNIPITGLGANSSYTLGISTSSAMPVVSLTLTAPQVAGGPTAVQTSNVPQDASFNSAIPRLEPQPTGALNSSFTLTGGAFQTVFNVAYTSFITLKTAYPAGSTGVRVALYQMGQQGTGAGGGVPYVSAEVLRDFRTTIDGTGNYTLFEIVQPGTYVLSGTGTVPGGGSAVVTGSIPPLPAKVITVEPTTGLVTAPEDFIINQGSSEGTTNGDHEPSFADSRYSSSFFAFSVPSNTNGQPVSVTLFDNDANSDGVSVGFGKASVTLWRFAGGVYTLVGSNVNALNDSGTFSSNAVVTSSVNAVAGDQYFVGVDLNAFATAVYVTAHIPVFVSGTPDFSVSPLQLLPNSGQTLVQDTITNASFTSSQQANYTLQLGNSTVTRVLPQMAPFGAYLVSAPYNPNSTADAFQVVANPTAAVPELSSTNNASQLAHLSDVDATRPNVQISLADAAMTGEDPAVEPFNTDGKWGRYISGIKGQTATINVSGNDPDGDYFQVKATGPTVKGQPAFTISLAAPTGSASMDFSTLGTNAANNIIQFYSLDNFGLRSLTHIQQLDVVSVPDYLTGGLPAIGVAGAGGDVKFDLAHHAFNLKFQDALINRSLTTSELLGFDVPLIGDTNNQFLVAINASGTGGMNPNVDIPLNFVANISFIAVDQKLFSKDLTPPAADPSFVFNAQTLLNGRTLIPGSASIELQSTIDLGTIKSPLIPLATIGVPGIASIDAGVKFSTGAKLKLAAKLGLDQNTIDDSGFLGSIGLMSPTFIQPSVSASASIVGQAEVFGWDFASVSGTITLTINLTLGLDNNIPGAIIPFSDAGDHIGTSIDLALKVGAKASIPIIGDIWSYDYTLDTENIENTISQGIFLTDPPSFANGKFLPPASGPVPGLPAGIIPPPGTAVISNGNTMVGNNPVDANPQIVINPATGMGLSVQVQNIAAAGNPPLGNLAFSTRADSSSAWSALTPLPSTNDDSTPMLALTHDGVAASTPAVVVYTVDNVAGSPSNQTFNQRLLATDLRYRYFDGTSWGAETAITNDNLFDSQQSTAFNASGEGVLAFVHNTSTTPLSNNGQFAAASNDIEASTWNSATHSWNGPITIGGGNGVSDSQPATFVDSSGKRYIVWIQTSGAGATQIMFSTSTGGGAWSAPAPLSISGLAAGGTFKRVAIGSDGAGRVNVIFSYSVINPDGSMTNTLYERPATTGGFANLLPAVQLAQNADFSSVHTTNTSTGALVVYWQQSDGQLNQIFETTITNGVATTPVQLTNDPDIASNPSAAVDTNGKLQVLYDNNVVFGGTSQGAPNDPSVGAPTAPGVASSSVANLPQLSFTQGLQFPFGFTNTATVGTTLTGTAVLTNRGLAAGNVTVTAYNGPPGTGTVLGTQTFTLQPGASFNYSRNFTILAGNQTYSLQATASGGQAFNATDNQTSITINGLVDVASTNLSTDSGNIAPGQSTTIFESFHNNSNTAIGPFTVTLYKGDPLTPQFPLTVVGTQNVNSLAANADGTVSFLINVPAGAGDDVYTAVVDSADVITESNEGNNESRFEQVFKADPAVLDPITGSPATAVVPTLLNSNTSNNVQVVVNVTNLGSVPMFNVPVNLSVSRNSGSFTSLGQMVIPELDGGASVAETFTVTALAGDNLFVGSIDNSQVPLDSNASNNSASGDLIVPGLPTLSATITLSGTSAVPGASLTLTAHLTNTGLGDAPGIPITVLAGLTSGGPSYVIGTATADLLGLGSTTVRIHLNTAGLAPGNYTITFQIDPQQTIPQGSEAGNTVTASETLVAGAIGSFSMDVPAQRLDYNFGSGVPGNINAASLVLTNTTTSQTITPASFSITGGGNVASFTFPSFARGVPSGHYHATINGGSPFDFSVLVADANFDGQVNSFDFNVLAQNFNQTSGVTYSLGDFNYDGKVNALDFNALAANFGGTIAPAPPLQESRVSSASASPGLRGLFGDKPIQDSETHPLQDDILA